MTEIKTDHINSHKYDGQNMTTSGQRSWPGLHDENRLDRG